MDGSLTRRGLLGTTAAGLAAVPLVGEALPAQAAPAQVAVVPAPGAGVPMLDVVLSVNGQERRLSVEPRTTLLDALREQIGLTGTKKGCDHGACGACTVHVDRRRVVSCLVLAARAQGQAITTIEGLAPAGQGGAEGALHPVQAAFIEHDGYQCGYCTPGQIMSAAALITEGHAGSAAEIREWMSGNICRCGAYNNIVAAVQDAAGVRHAGPGLAPGEGIG